METKTEDESKDASNPSSVQSPPEGSKPATEQLQTAPATEEVPDPDEDDLDDLDDMLDEFSAAKPPPPSQQKPKEPAVDESDPFSSSDFAKQLQAGMADLMGQLDESPEMQAEFEAMMKDLGEASSLDAAPAASSSKSAPTSTDESFQETIKKTMERMQASGDKATAAAVEDEPADFLAEMMKQMQAGALGGEGSEDELSKMLMGMMEQLTNKDILYEPMKELDDKFPAWLEKNRASTPPEDLGRYLEQQKLVGEIVKKFEESGYSDSNVQSREYIVDRMQRMQAAGSPPPDLVGDMAAAQDIFSGPDEGCPTQ